MKVLIVGPNIDDSNQIGGIITVIKTILSTITIDYSYFSRSPKLNEKNLKGKLNWFKKINEFTKNCNQQNPDIVHIHTAMNTSALFRDVIWVFIAKVLRIKILLHVHGGKYLFRAPNNPVVCLIKKLLFKLSDAIVVLSETEKEELIATHSQKDKKVFVLENAIDLNQIPPLEIKTLNPEKLDIVFLGRICESKGIDDLIQALILLKNDNVSFQFNLYGQGELERSTVSLLQSELKDQFTFYGVVSGNEKWNALQKSDIFILPSRYGEGLPMTILEAMALGKIVIATNDASIGTVIQNANNGFIVEKYNPQSITETIKSISSYKAKDLLNISRNAITTVNQKYSAAKYIIELETIYNTLV